MENRKIILASASPRRSELLELAGFDFEVKTSDIDEVIDSSLKPQELVMSLAEQKAGAVAKCNEERIVIGADTVVVLGGMILGKPKNKDDAEKMLQNLSGKVHEVFTGVCIIKDEKVHNFFEKTKVKFCELDQEQIKAYVESGEPMDKAGAYGIQGKGCVLVEGIEGDYFNVVGFPISRFCRELKRLTN